MTPFRSKRTLRAPRLPARDAARRFGRRRPDSSEPANSWRPLLLRWRRRPRLAAPSPTTRVDVHRIVQWLPRLHRHLTTQSHSRTIEWRREALATTPPRPTPAPSPAAWFRAPPRSLATTARPAPASPPPSPFPSPWPIAPTTQRFREILKTRSILVIGPPSSRPPTPSAAPTPTASRGGRESRPSPSSQAVASPRLAASGRRWPSPAPLLLRAFDIAPGARVEIRGVMASAAEARRDRASSSEYVRPRPFDRPPEGPSIRRGETPAPIAGSRFLQTTFRLLNATVWNRPGPSGAVAVPPVGAGARIAGRGLEPIRSGAIAAAPAPRVSQPLSQRPTRPMSILSATILTRSFAHDVVDAEPTPGRRWPARRDLLQPSTRSPRPEPRGTEGRRRDDRAETRPHPEVESPKRGRSAIAPEELVWRPSPKTTASQDSEDQSTATDSTAAGRSPSSRIGTARPTATSSSGESPSSSTITRIDPALLDRLTDDVIRRVEQRARIDRQRRGI